MSKTMSEAERREFLSGVCGLNPDAPALESMPARVVTHVATNAGADVVLAPPGVDPRLMPVEEIVFDPHLLDAFPSLQTQMNAASSHVFTLYQSYGKNKLRNGALHRKITAFITLTRRNRETGGMVTEGIKASKESRDLAMLLESQGITAADLAAMLKNKG